MLKEHQSQYSEECEHMRMVPQGLAARTSTEYALDSRNEYEITFLTKGTRLLNQEHQTSSSPGSSDLFFLWYAATQLALQLCQERSQVVCGNKEALKHPRHGPWT